MDDGMFDMFGMDSMDSIDGMGGMGQDIFALSFARHYSVVDDYWTYTIPAAENGLGGTPVQVSGTVEDIAFVGDYMAAFINNGNDERWLIAFDYAFWGDLPSHLNPGDNISVLGTYEGISGLFGGIPLVLAYRTGINDRIIFSALVMGTEAAVRIEGPGEITDSAFGFGRERREEMAGY
jgi:hypothetical protein